MTFHVHPWLDGLVLLSVFSAACADSRRTPLDRDLDPMEACRIARGTCVLPIGTDPYSEENRERLEKVCRKDMLRSTCPWRQECAGLRSFLADECWARCFARELDFEDIERTPCIEAILDFYRCEVEMPACEGPSDERPECEQVGRVAAAACDIEPCFATRPCPDGFVCRCPRERSCSEDDVRFCEPTNSEPDR